MGMLEQQTKDLTEIKVVGFDLDGTLYPSTKKIQEKITIKIYEKLSKHFRIPYGKAKGLFEEIYENLCSGSRTIMGMAKQLNKPLPEGDIVQESLEEADILYLIERNPELVCMLSRLSETKTLDLLTGSARPLAIKKLQRLGVPPQMFTRVYTDGDGSKSSGELYQKWLQDTLLIPKQHIYVGDNKRQDVDSPKNLGIRTCIVGEYDTADFQIPNILGLESILQLNNF